MKERIDELEQWGSDVIFGRARGFRAALMRLSMSVLAGLFRLLVQLRLSLFRNGIKQQQYLGTQVISVGNLTVGGTGKTPVVELLTKSLRDRGRKVAILSRGYKSKSLKKSQKWRDHNDREIPREDMPKVVSTGSSLLLDSKFAGDEPYMLAKNLPGIAVIVDKDRAKGARFAVDQLDCETLVLDDGMQNFALAHSLDIVLIDSRSPFGTERMLPRGTLREPPKNLRRAAFILITKCDGSSNKELIRRIRTYNATAEIIECTHGPQYIENVFTGEKKELSFLKDRWVGAISAIAVPQSFEKLLESLGAKVEITKRFSDHHRFNQKDIDKFMYRCVERDMEAILTTEKDAVRFPQPSEIDVPIYFLRIEVKILNGQESWDRMINLLCDRQPLVNPSLRNLGQIFE